MRGHATRKTIPLAIVITVLAVACSRVPPGGEVTIGEGAPAAGSTGFVGGTTSSDSPAGGATDVGTTTGATVTGTGAGTVGSRGTTGGTTGGATAGGSTGDGTDGSTDAGGATTGTTAPQGPGLGIEGNTIKIAFHNHQEDCPNQETEPNDNVRAKGRLVIDEYVRFFNEFVLAEHGWQLDHTIVDDGGYFCPERQRAAGLKLAKEIRPFAVLGGSSSAQGPIIADLVTREGILHLGSNWDTQEEEAARHPYAWNIFPTPEKAMRVMVGWMDRRLKGTPVPDRSTPMQPEVDRVYGILGLDEATGRELAKITREEMVAKGLEVRATYFVAPGAGVAAQQAPTTVAKMKDDGVNTLVWALAFGGGKDFYVAVTNAMDQQNYLPDIVLGTGGNAFFEQLAARRVWANAKGTSSYPAIALRVATTPDGPIEEYDEVNENSTAYVKAWEHLGHNDNPQDQSNPAAYGTWAQLAMLATGIIHAGETLNAHSWAQGLEAAGSPGKPGYCTVARFMGRDYKHVATFEWNAEHDGGGEGFTPIYWVNEQTPFGTNGYYESYDNYVYFRSTDDIPREPTHDTGQQDPDIPKQERIGLVPWKSCADFPNFPQ